MSNHVYTAGPASATTSSSVHEFICLFSHDLKRKTKRWQDGKLRYHTFNGRVMVYDERGSFVGDAHVPGSPASLDEGEEMTLDRGGAIVQVCEMIGELAVDLEPLVDKRAREVEKRRREAAEKAARQQQRTSRPAVPSGAETAPRLNQNVQRSLSAIVQTPGRIGRAAIPKESPYERRMQQQQQRQEQDATSQQPRKRVKRSQSPPPSKMGHARSLFGTQLNLSAPTSSWSSRAQVLRERTNMMARPMPLPQKERERDKEEDAVAVQSGEKQTDSATQLEPRSEDEDKESSAQKPKTAEMPRLGGIRISRKEDSGAHNGPRDGDLSPRDKTTRLGKLSKTTTGTGIDRAEATIPGQNAPSSKTALGRVDISAAHRSSGNNQEDEPRSKKAREEPRKKKKMVEDRDSPEGPLRKVSINSSALGQKSRQEEFRRMGGDESSSLGDAQPRTELRIRARKKRGLLMLTEKIAEPVKQASPSPPPVSGEPSSEEEKTEEAENQVEIVQQPIAVELSSLTPADGEGFEEWYAKSLAEAAAVQPESTDNGEDDHPMSSPVSEDAGLSNEVHQRSTLSSTDDDVRDEEIAQRPHKGSGVDGGCSPPGDSTTDEDAFQKEDTPSDESDVPRTRRAAARIPKSTIPDCAMGGSDSDESWQGPATTNAQARQTRRSNANPRSAIAEQRKQGTKKADTGPRISRISKTSKSKEIFGFQLPDGTDMARTIFGGALAAVGNLAPAPVQEDMARQDAACDGSGQNRPAGQQPSTRTNDLAGDTSDGRDSSSDAMPAASTAAAPVPPVPLANPATRGKKAASRADAAGQVPLAIVPLDAPVEAAPRLAKADERPAQQPRNQVELPGFSKANGGAWSRHAYDLLGMARPKGRG